MSTRTKTPSRTQSTIVLNPEELEAPGLESGERFAGVVAGDLPVPAAPGRELSPPVAIGPAASVGTTDGR
jgi:hypothetical protein